MTVPQRQISKDFVVPSGTTSYDDSTGTYFKLVDDVQIDGIRVTPKTSGMPNCFLWVGIVFPEEQGLAGIEFGRGYVSHSGAQGIDFCAFPRLPVGGVRTSKVIVFVQNLTGSAVTLNATLFYSKVI